MKIMRTLKFSGLLALILAGAVGCATAPEETPQDVQAEQMAAAEQAIKDARDAIQRAEAAGLDMTEASKLLADAEAALAEGDTAKAIQLANEARRMAEDALAKASAAPVEDTGAGSYTVSRGDNLWSISGRQEIYGNPYQWPLIYKANRDQIRDADLIHPGQVLSIDRNASSADIDAAVNHARTRGSWSLGVTESSDKAYLSR